MTMMNRVPWLWFLRSAGVIALAFLFASTSLTQVFAEESSEPVAEEPAADESDSAPESQPEYEPPAEAYEGVGGWALVDPETGEVQGVHVCSHTVCGPNGSWGGKLPGTNYVYRFQTRATPDGNVAGWGDATWDAPSGTFRVDNGETSFTIVPEKTSRDSDGTGRSYNIGSGIVDITTDKTFRSGDTSASVRTYRSDYQNPWLDVTMSLPDLGPDGSAFSYGLQFRTDGSAERPSVLDQIGLDIDSALVDKGYVVTETGIDGETGEETTTQNLDSDNAFVVAVRDVMRSVVEFLSSLLGFGRG